ncbi:hypothetical protein KUTeg_020877 [Tegillarca granosa]|uniref:Receptor ligand binding region domain-containing protein n=1 Tax=Tegillarca granosa TaxID=220873 RepID=A0ABQ9EEM3_TEGGR|nr:hypothetical protein KUTeg_020877 [Tegillarca granosa]
MFVSDGIILVLYLVMMYLVGNFTNGSLVLSDDTQLINSKSLCKSQCENCFMKEDISFIYVPGDLLILGLFSVSGSNDDSDSATAGDKYKCGEYRDGTFSVITALSFIQAIKSLNDNLTNFNFGGIALDDCYNPLNISYLLAELFSGKRQLRDRTSGQLIDMSKVVAVVGALSSKVTQVITDQMTTLKIPVLSYGASSAALDDRVRYPFFLRTVPSDTLQVDGLIEVLVHFDFTHIGAIYYNDAYGLSGIKDFQRKAMQRKICVENLENITEGFRKQDVEKLINNLRRNLVDVVLFYGIDTAAKELLEVLAEDTESSPFTFIASEAWGINPRVISGNLGNQAKGSLVFLTDTNVHLNSKFLAYLENLTPGSESNNPWLMNFWQDRFQCSFPESYNKKYSSVCKKNQRLSKAQAKAMYDEQRGIHAMHAVFAVREGIRSTLFQICGTNLVCKNLRTTTGAEMLTKAIRTSTVTSEHGNQLTPFKEDGNGYMGFTIYNIQRRSDNTYNYVPVGSYSQENKLQLRMDNLTFYDRLGYPTKKIEAKCSHKFSKCSSVCPQTVEQTTTPDVTSTVTSFPANNTSVETTVMPIILGVVIGILVIIVILLIILMLRQQKTKSLIKEQSMASIASRHASSLNIYDEPRSNDGHIGFHGRENRSFEPSTSSGIVNSSNSSSTLRKDIGPPIQYTHISGVERKGTHSQLSNASTPSLNRRLSASLNSLRSGSGISQSGHHIGPSPLAIENTNESTPRRHSADDVLSDSNGLTYMTAKDFEMADEDLSPQTNVDYLPMSDTNLYIASSSDRDSSLEPIRPKQKPLRRKLAKSNSIEMKSLPKTKVTSSPNRRPKTLPGLNPRNAPTDMENQVVFSNATNAAPVENQDLYLNPVIQKPNEHFYIDQGHGTFMSGQLVQTPGGHVMLVQSPNQRFNPEHTQLQQPTMIVYPNTYLTFDGQEPANILPVYNHQNTNQITSPIHHGDMLNAHGQLNPNQRFSPRLSPSSTNMSPKLSPPSTNMSPRLSPSNTKPSPRLSSPSNRNLQNAGYLQNSSVPLQMGQVPHQHLPLSETGYLVPNDSQMVPNLSTVPQHHHSPNNLQNFQHFPAQNDNKYLNPLNNTSNEQPSKLLLSPDYINSQKEANLLTMKSVPDVVLHSSSEMEEEVII